MTPLRYKTTHLGRKIRDLGFEPPAYRTIYNAILNGRIPADQLDGHHWTIAAEDLPKVIEALGLRPLQQAAAA